MREPNAARSTQRGFFARMRGFRIAAPMHAILVHFTIALSAASLAFDLAAVLLDDATLAAAGWWSLVAAAVITLATLASGLISRLRLAMEEGVARRYLRAHMALGPVAYGLLLLMALWRAAIWERTTIASWLYLSSMAGVMLIMTVQGYLGGELVYRFGAEVQDRFPRLPTEPPVYTETSSDHLPTSRI